MIARVIRKGNKHICLNVGCGLSHGKSWTNIDCSLSLRLTKLPLIGKPLANLLNFPKWPEEILYGDILKDDLVPENSCVLIFSSHVLEHLSFTDAKGVLKNFYRYLKTGGILRIIVPDLEVYLRNYFQRMECQDKKAADVLMKDLGMGMFESRKYLIARLKSSLSNSRHHWMYNKHSLEALLEETGFKEIRVSSYGNWSDERFAEVEEKERHVNSVCIEAYK